VTDDTAQGPGVEASSSGTSPLTAVVIAPGWALVYGATMLALNLALQFGARSEAVLATLRLIVSDVVGSGAADRALATAALSAAVMVASYGLMLLPAIAVAVAARRRGVGLAAAVGLRATDPGRTLRLSVGVVVAGFAVMALYATMARALGVTVQGNTAGLVVGFGAGPVEMVLAFLLVGVVAPFVEEVTFRGIVFPSLQSSWGTWPAMLVSGAIFGIVHLQPAIAVPLAVLGMVLAVVFLRTRSLWTAIVAHCAYNTVSLALAFVLLR